MYSGIFLQRLKRAGVLLAVGLTLPSIGLTSPNSNSVADINACLQDGAAFVCSSKELSNVVLECVNGEGLSTFVRKEYDEVVVPLTPYTDLVDECPPGSSIASVFVKSGSEKKTDTDAPFGGVGGQAAMFGLLMCSDPTFVCPTPNAEEDGGGEDPAGGDDPVGTPQ